ncbi:MAG TPA: iron-containing redox enzyme family protein [Miltoncostaeaceae bacterium]|nr:iron-containing redox enzyme family protein [Miltoncostaeaceae bacterium]
MSSSAVPLPSAAHGPDARPPAHPPGPPLPAPRGRLTEMLVNRLAGPPVPVEMRVPPSPDPLADEDLQLGLYVMYELHYRGFAGVDERWEWWPPLLALRARLEGVFEDALRAAVPPPADDPRERLDDRLRRLVREDDGPSLSTWIERNADLERMREFLVHRSAYQLKEADPHSWAIPRLHGGPKAALVEIQADEYGGGDPTRMHAALFGRAMEGLGLRSAYGAYIDRIPATTLATVNLMSLCGLHRRLRGAIVGHLAVFEMTSSEPNRRYARAARRLGVDDDAVLFFDEHVEADAVHEAIAAYDLAAGLARDEPMLRTDVLWGAAALMELDARAARPMIAAWDAGRSSLRGDAPLVPA